MNARILRTSILVAVCVVFVSNLCFGWEWTGDAKARIKTSLAARDAKTPEAVDFLLTGLSDADDGVVVRCLDYIKRLVVVQGVPVDREALCKNVSDTLPARSYQLTEKTMDLVSSLGPCDAGRSKIEEVLMSDDVKVSVIALKSLIGVMGARDIMGTVKDVFDRVKDKPAGNHDSLSRILKAGETFSSDKGYQLYVIRAIGILGEDGDEKHLAPYLNADNLNPTDKDTQDQVIYALRAAAMFKGGDTMIEPYIANANPKIAKAALKAREEWAKKDRGADS